MNDPFAHSLKIVTTFHVSLAVALMFGHLFRSLFRARPEIVLPLEFVVEAPLATPGPEKRTKPEPPSPRPEPDDAIPEPSPPKPPKPAQAKTAPPKPEPPKPAPRKDIEPNRARITRTTGGPGTGKPLSEAEIRKYLAMGAVLGDHTSIPGEEALGFLTIKNALYAVWEQPSAEEAGSAVAEVAIRLEKDGRILSWDLVRSSGNPVLDASVMSIGRMVRRIDGLTPGFLRTHPRVTVTFKVDPQYGGAG